MVSESSEADGIPAFVFQGNPGLVYAVDVDSGLMRDLVDEIRHK